MTADELVDDGDVLDLTAVAQAHPARRVRLDIAAIEAAGLLSVGDVVDMAEKLHTEPAQLAAVLSAGDPVDGVRGRPGAGLDRRPQGRPGPELRRGPDDLARRGAGPSCAGPYAAAAAAAASAARARYVVGLAG